MVVIDSDVVQMPRGEWEIEMNVTDRTELVLYINGLWNCCSHRERGKGRRCNGWCVGKCHRWY